MTTKPEPPPLDPGLDSLSTGHLGMALQPATFSFSIAPVLLAAGHPQVLSFAVSGGTGSWPTRIGLATCNVSTRALPGSSAIARAAVGQLFVRSGQSRRGGIDVDVVRSKIGSVHQEAADRPDVVCVPGSG